MNKEAENACQEYQTLTRRSLLAGASAMVATGPVWMPKIAFAKDGSSGERDRLILINLRGGSDGLSFCCPHGDPEYYRVRPHIAVPQPGAGSNAAIDIDGYFGFAKAFEEFLDPFNSKHLAVLHAVGRENWSFSHFDAIKWMEQGDAAVNGQGGWLARHLASVDEMVPDSEIRAMNLYPSKPVVLHGGKKVFSAGRPEEIKYGGYFGDFDTNEVKKTFLRQYMRLRDKTRESVRDGIRAVDLIDRLKLASYVPDEGVVYDDTDLGNAMRVTAAMMKADVGIEVFHTQTHGWDTHIEQGTNDGALNSKMNDLARNVTMLYRDLMAQGITNWTLVIVSEFGRRVVENGGHGCEHGEANTMFVLSPNLKSSAGGTVITDWPGLEDENLTYHKSLRPTLDDRDVWAEILQKRLQNPNVDFVLPMHQPEKHDLLFDAA